MKARCGRLKLGVAVLRRSRDLGRGVELARNPRRAIENLAAIAVMFYVLCFSKAGDNGWNWNVARAWRRRIVRAWMTFRTRIESNNNNRFYIEHAVRTDSHRNHFAPYFNSVVTNAYRCVRAPLLKSKSTFPSYTSPAAFLHTDGYDSIARTAGKIILTNGGIIRGFTNWGVSTLPKPLPNRSAPASNQPTNSKLSSDYAPQSNKHTIGHYFIMRFDSSARAQHLLRKTWNADPRLLRFSVVKMAGKFEDMCDVGGKAEEWVEVSGNEGQLLEEDDKTAQERDEVMGSFVDDVLGGTGTGKTSSNNGYTY